jgi:hypothetical protein
VSVYSCSNVERDIAAIKIPAVSIPPLSVGNSDEVKIGDHITLVLISFTMNGANRTAGEIVTYVAMLRGDMDCARRVGLYQQGADQGLRP